MAGMIGAGDRRWAWRTVAVPVTSDRDGFEHLVAESAMTPGSAGRYVACCGRVVWAAALACPPGPRCPACVAVRNADAARAGRRRRQQWAWLTLVRRRQRAAGATTFLNVALPVYEPESSQLARGLVPPPPAHWRRSR